MRALVHLVLFVGLGIQVQAMAQIPVTDVAALAQLIMQLQRQTQQLTAIESQLTQARQTHDALTGSRGMERLLAGTQRNYLPGNAEELVRAIRGLSAAYPRLSAEIRSAVEANVILRASDLENLDRGDRLELESARRSAAALSALSREQLQATSDRFASLQQLIEAIGHAGDPKASLDLAARISAEQTMVMNEANKLRVLNQSLEAERLLNEQRRRERAVLAIGSLRQLPALGLRVE